MASHGPVYVTSDAHLGAVSAERERDFLSWLEDAAERASEIVLNGDLFDFWFEYRTAVPRGHARVLGALARVVDSGVPVRLMGGNHDWWAGSFLRDEIGLILHHDPVVLELAGHRTLLAHGDGLGSGDLGYRMLRLVLRGRATRWAFRWLHPDVGARVAAWVSRTGDRADGTAEAEIERARALEAWATARIEEDRDLDLVILGHTHIPTLREVEPGRWYLNAGDWVHHRSYAVLEAGRAPRLEAWPAGGRATGVIAPS